MSEDNFKCYFLQGNCILMRIQPLSYKNDASKDYDYHDYKDSILLFEFLLCITLVMLSLSMMSL